MKDAFVNSVQKCICLDLLINSLIYPNTNKYQSFLVNMKNENIKNIKDLCCIYKYNFKDNMIVKNYGSIKSNTNSLGIWSDILKTNLIILSNLQTLKNHKAYCYNSVKLDKICDNYLKSVITIQYLVPKLNNINFIRCNETDKISKMYNDCINAIYTLFDYSLDKDKILFYSYDLFFKNSSENKFYQYYFKTIDKVFKVNFSDKNNKIIKLYQSNQNSTQIAPPLNKSNSKKIVDNFLYQKLTLYLGNLIYDETYINTFTYNNLIESYTFKYNFKKFDDYKGFCITINTYSTDIEEISLF